MALVSDSELIRLLKDEKVEEFNRLAEAGPPDLANANLRMADLRRAVLRRAVLRGAYLRGADLRGVDLSGADLDGASLHEAHVAGALFPRDLPAAEIELSLTYGTRLRAVAPAAGR